MKGLEDMVVCPVVSVSILTNLRPVGSAEAKEEH